MIEGKESNKLVRRAADAADRTVSDQSLVVTGIRAGAIRREHDQAVADRNASVVRNEKHRDDANTANFRAHMVKDPVIKQKFRKDADKIETVVAQEFDTAANAEERRNIALMEAGEHLAENRGAYETIALHDASHAGVRTTFGQSNAEQIPPVQGPPEEAS